MTPRKPTFQCSTGILSCFASRLNACMRLGSPASEETASSDANENLALLLEALDGHLSLGRRP
jgi:hypothetical protein